MSACAIQRPIAPRTAVRLLAVGLAVGVLSAALPARAAFPGLPGFPGASDASGVVPVAVMAVPLLLAGLTGVAKTTTA